jgi:hypothetical protein
MIKNWKKFGIFALGAAVATLGSKVWSLLMRQRNRKGTALYPSFTFPKAEDEGSIFAGVAAYEITKEELAEFHAFLLEEEQAARGESTARPSSSPYREKFRFVPRYVEELLFRTYRPPRYQLRYDMGEMVRVYRETGSIQETAERFRTTEDLVKARIDQVRSLVYAGYYINHEMRPSETASARE